MRGLQQQLVFRPMAALAVLAGSAVVVLLILAPTIGPPGGTGFRSAAATPISEPIHAQVADASLTVDSIVSAEELPVGGRVTVDVRVMNTGPVRAERISVVDEIPSGFVVVSSQPLGAITDSTVSWDLGPLDVGATATAELVLRATAPGVTTNRITVTGDGEPLQSNTVITVVESSLVPVVEPDSGVTPAAPTSPGVDNQLPRTGTAANAAVLVSLIAVAAGAALIEISTRVPAMSTLRKPRSQPAFAR